MARCSCGGIIKSGKMFVEDDERHGEKVLKTVYFCEECGRMYGMERPFVRTTPTKKERSERA